MLSRSSRFIAALIVISAVALIMGSCGTNEQRSPIAPSSIGTVSGLQSGSLAEEAPDPAPPNAEPEPGPQPPPDGDVPPNPDPPATDDPALPPAPAPTPGGPPAILPGPVMTHPLAAARVEPSPVPYSGQPINDVASCRDLKHTWFYEQVLYATSGISVTFTERDNFFDGRFVSKVSASIPIPGNGTVRLQSRWCSGYPIAHTAQTNFRGRDENGNPVVISTRAQLQPR